MASPDIAGILENSKELDQLRKEQEDVLLEINKMHKKLQTTNAAPEVVEKPGDNSLSKLKVLYTRAKELSESEVSISSQLVNQLDALLPPGPPGQPRRRIGKGKVYCFGYSSMLLAIWHLCCHFGQSYIELHEEEGNEQKKKRLKTDSDITRLSPSMRNQLEICASLKGEQVAARVTPHDADKDEWFVVKVMHFDKETKEFEVLDEEPGDDEEGGGQRKYRLPVANIIPFPKRNDTAGAPDFPHGRQVLAVYPGTTALYKATVVNGHRKRKTDDYLLEFDDDEEDGSLPQRTVPFHKVVPLPEGHRQ